MAQPPMRITILVAGIAGAAALLPASTMGATTSVTIKAATVSSTGVLDTTRSSGATSAMRAAQGTYKITFSASLTRCAVSAVSLAGTTSSNAYTWSTRIATAISGSSLYVTTMGRNDGPADYPFSVVLACRPITVVTWLGPTTPVAADTGEQPIRFATVSSTGVLKATLSYGAATAMRAAQGKYKIAFSSSLTRCAVSAASLAGTTSSNTYTWSTRIATAISGSSLYVTTMGRNDGPADYPFSVVLACRPATAITGPTPITQNPVPGSTSEQPIRFATVSSTGVLKATLSYGATSAMHAAQGKYKITFSSSLTRCAVSAASLAGTTSSNTYTWSTRIATAISGSSLYVTTMGRNDVPADFPFSVVLACN